jgi:hypothetical protein
MTEELDGTVNPGARNCKEELLKIISSVVGNKMAKLILYQKMRDLDIHELNDSSEYIQKILISELFKENMLKILDESEIKSLKLVLFSKLYGKDKAQEFLYEDFYVKTKKPMDFVYAIFGKVMGDVLIKHGQQKFGISNVKHVQEYKQVIFMEQLFKIMFDGFPEEMHDSIKLSMVKFVKLGDKKDILNMQQLVGKYNLAPEEIIRKIQKNITLLDAKEDVEKMKSDDIMDFLKQISEDDKAKMQMFYMMRKDSMHKKSGNDRNEELKNQNIITDMKDILGAYMDHDDVDYAIKMTLQELSMDKVTEAIMDPSDFIDGVINNSIIKEFSVNKVSIIKDKLRAVIK